MYLVYGFIFVTVGSIAFYLYVVAANEQFKDEITRYKNENLKIITNIRSQEQRVYTRHNSTIKANEVIR